MTNERTQGTCGTQKPSQITKPTKTGKNIKTNAETPKKKLRKEGLRQRTSSRHKPKHLPQSRKCRKIPDQVPQRVLPPVLAKVLPEVLVLEATEVNRPLVRPWRKKPQFIFRRRRKMRWCWLTGWKNECRPFVLADGTITEWNQSRVVKLINTESLRGTNTFPRATV